MEAERFTKDETEAIKTAFREGMELKCPRCDSKLVMGQPEAGGGTVPPVYEIRCTNCDLANYIASRW